MADTKKRHRVLTAEGYKNVSGWVSEEDAPRITDIIDKHAPKVSAIVEKLEKESK